MAVGDAAADAMHFRMNSPDAPYKAAMDRGELTFPPYTFQPFPSVLYHASEGQTIVRNESEKAALLSRGWAEGPADVDTAQDHYVADTIAVAAAHRAYEDRNMSPAAQAEIAEAEATTDDYLAEVPEQSKHGRGRPRKVPR